MFNITRKKSDSAVQQQQQSNCALIKEKPKFTRCVSIARLFGNAYSTHHHMSRQKNDATSQKARILFKHRSSNATNRLKIERFKNRSESQIDHTGMGCSDFRKTDKLPIEDFCDEKDLSARAIRTISKGFGLIWRRSYSVEISTPDPEYKVFYLGNVLTGWAKGMYYSTLLDKRIQRMLQEHSHGRRDSVSVDLLLRFSVSIFLNVYLLWLINVLLTDDQYSFEQIV